MFAICIFYQTSINTVNGTNKKLMNHKMKVSPQQRAQCSPVEMNSDDESLDVDDNVRAEGRDVGQQMV